MLHYSYIDCATHFCLSLNLLIKVNSLNILINWQVNGVDLSVKIGLAEKVLAVPIVHDSFRVYWPEHKCTMLPHCMPKQLIELQLAKVKANPLAYDDTNHLIASGSLEIKVRDPTTSNDILVSRLFVSSAFEKKSEIP